MATKRTAWLTDTTANEKSLAQVGVTVVVAILYAVLASSCGAELDTSAPTEVVVDGAAGAELQAPTVVSALPTDGALVHSEVIVRVIFSQAMAEGAQGALIVSALGQPIAGERAWDTTRTVLAFRPAAELAIGDYELVVDIDAAAQSGATLGEPYVAMFTVAAAGSHK
jgi:hypothetical protein